MLDILACVIKDLDIWKYIILQARTDGERHSRTLLKNVKYYVQSFCLMTFRDGA